MSPGNLGAAHLSVSVNLLARQVSRPDLIAHIRRALAESGLSPHSLQLAVTESVLAENNETAFAQSAELGVGLCVADFGTMLSLSSNLPRLPVSTLKVGRPLIGAVADDEESAEVVRTMVMLRLPPSMTIVAKGGDGRAGGVTEGARLPPRAGVLLRRAGRGGGYGMAHLQIRSGAEVSPF